MGGRGGKIVNLQEENLGIQRPLDGNHEAFRPGGVPPEMFGQMANLSFHPSSTFVTIFAVLAIIGSTWCLCKIVRRAAFWERFPAPPNYQVNNREVAMQNLNNQNRERERERV